MTMQRPCRRSVDRLNPFTLRKKSADELKKELEARGLPTEGSKAQLIDRLSTFLCKEKGLSHGQNLPEEEKIETPKRKKAWKRAANDGGSSSDDESALSSVVKRLEINHLPSEDVAYLDKAIKSMASMDEAFEEYSSKFCKGARKVGLVIPEDTGPQKQSEVQSEKSAELIEESVKSNDNIPKSSVKQPDPGKETPQSIQKPETESIPKPAKSKGKPDASIQKPIESSGTKVVSIDKPAETINIGAVQDTEAQPMPEEKEKAEPVFVPAVSEPETDDEEAPLVIVEDVDTRSSIPKQVPKVISTKLKTKPKSPGRPKGSKPKVENQPNSKDKDVIAIDGPLDTSTPWARPKRTPKPSRRSLESMEFRRDFESQPPVYDVDADAGIDDQQTPKPPLPLKITPPKKIKEEVEVEKVVDEGQIKERKKKHKDKDLSKSEKKKKSAAKDRETAAKPEEKDKKSIKSVAHIAEATKKSVASEMGAAVVEEKIDDEVSVFRPGELKDIFSIDSDSSDNELVIDESRRVEIKCEPMDVHEYPTTSQGTTLSIPKPAKSKVDRPREKSVSLDPKSVKKPVQVVKAKPKQSSERAVGLPRLVIASKPQQPAKSITTAKKVLPPFPKKPAQPSHSARIVMARAESKKTSATTVDVLGSILGDGVRSGVIQKPRPRELPPKRKSPTPSASADVRKAFKPDSTFPTAYSIPHKKPIITIDDKLAEVKRLREMRPEMRSPMVRNDARAELKYNTHPDRNRPEPTALSRPPDQFHPRRSDSPPPPPPSGPRPQKRPFIPQMHAPPAYGQLITCMVTPTGLVPVPPPPVNFAPPPPLSLQSLSPDVMRAVAGRKMADDDQDNSSLAKRIKQLTSSEEPVRMESPPPPPPPPKRGKEPGPGDSPYSPGGTPPLSPPMNTPPRSPYQSPVPSPFRKEEGEMSPHTPSPSPVASPFITRDDYDELGAEPELKRVKVEEEKDSEESSEESSEEASEAEEGRDSPEPSRKSPFCPMSPPTAARYIKQAGTVDFAQLKSIVDSTRKIAGAEREDMDVVVLGSEPSSVPIMQQVKQEPGPSQEPPKQSEPVNRLLVWRHVKLNERQQDVRKVLWGVINVVVNKEERRLKAEHEENMPKLSVNEAAMADLVATARKSHTSANNTISQVPVTVEHVDDDDEDVFDPEAPSNEISGEEIMKRYLPKKKKLEEEAPMDESQVQLDSYNADLHLTVSSRDRLIAEPLVQGGFALMWAGVKASYGVNQAKVAFQVKILKFLNVAHLAFDEQFPHDLRLGWSSLNAPLLLGESNDSYAFASVGKKAERGSFSSWGKSFGEKEIVTCCLDLDLGTISYYKNDEYLGIAFRLWDQNERPSQLKSLFPHIGTKNCKFEVNFGQKNEDDWAPLPPGYTFINNIPQEERIRNWVPKAQKGGTVLLMCGLPGCGKSRWVRHYLREHRNEKWNVISADTVLDCMRVNGLPRYKSHSGRWDMVMGFIAKAVNKLIALAPRRPNNYIIDQTNVGKDTRKRKLSGFKHFDKKVVVIVPAQEEFENRCLKQQRETGLNMPSVAMLTLKAVFSLPDKEEEEWIDEIMYGELAGGDVDLSKELIEHYNKEGAPWKPRPPGRFNGYAGGDGENNKRKRRRDDDSESEEDEVKGEKENEKKDEKMEEGEDVVDAQTTSQPPTQEIDNVIVEDTSSVSAEPVKASFWAPTLHKAAPEAAVEMNDSDIGDNVINVDWE